MRFLISCFFFVLTIGIQAQKSLFPIIENGQQGFIDSTGKSVIAPRFKAVGTFSEGLAAAREGGYYGYIDTKGDWQIPPQYDYATEFTEGFAIAFKNWKTFYINHKGEVPFMIAGATKIMLFKHGFAFVKVGKKTGVINKTGKWLIEPQYESISDFGNDLFKIDIYDNKNYTHNQGLIDTFGHWLVPLNIYSEINPFHNGYAKVDFLLKKNEDWTDDGFINQKGELIFRLKSSHELSIGYDAVVQDSIFVVNRGRKPKGEALEKGVTWSSKWDYKGLMNLKGELILDSFSNKYITAVGNGLFRVQDEEYQKKFVDKYGKRIDVKMEENETEEETLKSLYADFGVVHDEKSKEKPALRLKPNIKLMTYIDKQSSTVWQQTPTSTELDTLDIDYMSRGRFYARSESKANDQGYGGWGGSKNGTNTITQEMSFPKNKFTIEIRTTDTLHLEGKWMGYKVFVANNSTDTFRFDAQDSRLYMNMQAVDEQGVWRDIEYLPSSWCGNSYHVIALDPKQYWSFQTPLYKGSNPTRLRLKLMVKRKKGDKGYELYSNEIKGSINPAQFWRKREYYPNGIMDPYND